MLTLVQRSLMVGARVVGHSGSVEPLLVNDRRMRANIVLGDDSGVDVKVVMGMAQMRSGALLGRAVNGVLMMNRQTLRLRRLNHWSRTLLGRVLRLMLLLLVLRCLLRRSLLLLRRLRRFLGGR